MTAADQPRDRRGKFASATGHPPDPGVLDGPDPSKEMTWAEMLELLHDVAERLDPDTPVELVIAGGSALAARGLRDVTNDIDVITTIPPPVARAIVDVAQHRSRPRDWMNSYSSSFAPLGFDRSMAFRHGPLTVLSVSPDDLFVMKLDASRPHDLEDLRSLWPHCSYETAEAAVADFDERTPLGPKAHDPYLADWIRKRVIEPHERGQSSRNE